MRLYDARIASFFNCTKFFSHQLFLFNKNNQLDKPEQRSMHSLDQYPEDLRKKVTLLKHFKNYLIANGHNPKDNTQATLGEYSLSFYLFDSVFSFFITRKFQIRINSTKTMSTTDWIWLPKFNIPKLFSRSGLPRAHPDGIVDAGSKAGQRPYVKKWMKNKHAIMFQLSNKIVQVVFFDKTEVVLSSKAHMVTYVDKKNQRAAYPLQSVMEISNPELAKRLRYTKDILVNLLGGKK